MPRYFVECRSLGHEAVLELVRPSCLQPVASLTAFVDLWLAAHTEEKIEFVHDMVSDKHMSSHQRATGSDG